MTTEATSCEQVILAWSSSNLLGNSGMGPVAASHGWPLSSSDPLAGLGESSRYLSDSAIAAIDRGLVPPVCLDYRTGADGALLIAKVYAATSQRAGHYQVHAIKDPNRRSSPWDLWAARDAGVLITEELTDEPPMQLPRIDLAPARPPNPALAEVEVGPLRVLLERLLADRPFTIRSADQPAAENLARRLLSCLPLAVTRGIPVTTFAAQPSTAARGIALVIPPFSSGFASVDVDLDTLDLADGGNDTHDLALHLLNASRAELDAMSSLSELQAWVALRQADLSTLTTSQLRYACGALFPVLLERLAQQEPRGGLLWRIITDPEAAPAFADQLQSHAGESADLVAPLFASSADLPPATHAQVQEWLLQAIGTDAFERYVLGPLIAETADRVVFIDAPSLAEVLARRLRDRPELAHFTYRTSTSEWSALTDFQVQTHLKGGGPLPDPVRRMLAHDPRRLARAIDQVVDNPPDPRIGQALLRWPEDDLTTVLAAVMASNALERTWAARVLENKSAKVVGELLTDWWPRIATHLGIPDSVAEHLEVKKQRWWERWG